MLDADGVQGRVSYEPAESTTGLFGGNSNWRGPVWFPVNHLIIESLQKFDHFYGDALKVECPTGSEQVMTLWDVSLDLSRRLAGLFMRDRAGRRPAHGLVARFQADLTGVSSSCSTSISTGQARASGEPPDGLTGLVAADGAVRAPRRGRMTMARQARRRQRGRARPRGRARARALCGRA